jgi:pimeloyl-ACP methyl ester carboxylesterase
MSANLTPRRPRLWSIAVAVTLVISAGVIPGRIASASSAGGSATVTSKLASKLASKPKPTIVLVHGAFADGSSWDGVVQRLQHEGYTVDVPPNPLRGLAADAAYLDSYLATVKGPVVLVGHSYGGAVITDAATSDPNVKALVYVDAFVPDQGEFVAELVGTGSVLAGDPTKLFTFVPYPGAPAGDVDLYVQPSLFGPDFAGDLPSARSAVLAATQRPVAFSALTAPSGVPAWKTIPSWYLVGTEDLVIPPAQQRFMARRAHAHISTIDASHLSLISHPGAVERLIVAAARATS